jgi:TPR repeat protein
VLKDLTKATEWIKKATDAGHLKAAETWKTLELWKY